MSYKNLMLETVDRVATLTIRRPEVKNAIDLATMDELDEAVAALEADRALQGEAMPRKRGIAYEAECFGVLWGSRDHAEAAKARLEKRQPEFRGE